MSRSAAAALFAALTLAAASARAATRVSGTVLTAEVASDPQAGAGSLVIVDKGGRTAQYAVLGTTRVTRDGKDVKFDNALIGDLVVRAKYDPKTKTLTVLDLKSSGVVKPAKKDAAAPAQAAGPATVDGEVAFADAIKGALSVRLAPGRTRDFAVTEATKVLREKSEAPAQEIGFENVSVGDSVEVRSADGKTADSIRVRPAAR